jgi:hypothetical protein
VVGKYSPKPDGTAISDEPARQMILSPEQYSPGGMTGGVAAIDDGPRADLRACLVRATMLMRLLGREETVMRWGILVAAAIAPLASACATYSEKIPATYVSPVLYEQLTCRQIAEEATRVAQRAAEASGAQNAQANKDNALTAVTIVIFWPAAFFVGGDRANATEVGRLKGEMDALEQASIRKNCGIQFRQG